MERVSSFLSNKKVIWDLLALFLILSIQPINLLLKSWIMNFCNDILRADKAEKLLKEAAALGSQLVVFPEAFIGGYPRGYNFADQSPRGKESFRKYHASAINVPGVLSFSFSNQELRN